MKSKYYDNYPEVKRHILNKPGHTGTTGHDGFRLRKNGEGRWVFVEGINRPIPIVNRRDSACMNKCFKKRGL